jgi:hypothetical protein
MPVSTASLAWTRRHQTGTATPGAAPRAPRASTAWREPRSQPPVVSVRLVPAQVDKAKPTARRARRGTIASKTTQFRSSVHQAGSAQRDPASRRNVHPGSTVGSSRPSPLASASNVRRDPTAILAELPTTRTIHAGQGTTARRVRVLTDFRFRSPPPGNTHRPTALGQ